jgi:hypothetical protein
MWQWKHRSPQREQAQDPWALQSLYLEQRLNSFGLSPSDTERPAASLGTCQDHSSDADCYELPHWEEAKRFLPSFRPPGRKGLVHSLESAPWEIDFGLFWGFFFSLSLSLLLHSSFLVIVPSVGSGDNLPLYWERGLGDRASLLQSWLVCASAERWLPHCYLGKRESRC